MNETKQCKLEAAMARIRTALQMVEQDIRDRERIPQARKINLEIEVTPDRENQEPAVVFSVSATVPGYRGPLTLTI